MPHLQSNKTLSCKTNKASTSNNNQNVSTSSPAPVVSKTLKKAASPKGPKSSSKSQQRREKKNPENNNTINAISATKPEVEELTAKVHNFGISTLANEEEAAGTSSLKKPSYKDQLQGQRK